MFVAILIISALSLAYLALKSKYRYWDKRHVRGPRPSFFVGNLGPCFLMKTSPGELYSQIYRNHPESSVVGLYKVTSPVLLVRDPELIKEMTIKSFNHFRDNDTNVDNNLDPLWGRHPFVLRGDEWKMVRSQLSPGFTSGKMKWLYPLLEDIAKNLVGYIAQQPGTCNAKDLCMKFTLNNVASCAFGLEGRCFEEENSEFNQLAKEFMSPGGWTAAMSFVMMIFPVLWNVFPVRLVRKDVQDKLIGMVSQTVKYREENDVVRNDFLQILMQLKKSCQDFEFTDLDVAAHASGFIGDGYETSSAVMSFVLYNLAANPEAQTALREEIQENDSLSYEDLQNMRYLDAVINETLRIHPPVTFLQKLCTKSFTFKPKDADRPITVEEETPVVFPVFGLHRDPRLFEDPEAFKPDRFLGENKEKIVKCSFLPFGEGPRACVGQRFGVLQIKVGVAHIIKNYRVSVNEKTKVPLTFDPVSIVLTPTGGLWLDFEPIDKN